MKEYFGEPYNGLKLSAICLNALGMFLAKIDFYQVGNEEIEANWVVILGRVMFNISVLLFIFFLLKMLTINSKLGPKTLVLRFMVHSYSHFF